MFHFFERWRSGLRRLARYVLNRRRLLCAYSELPCRRAANEFSSPDMDCHATLTQAVMQRRARYHTCRAERASCHSACTSPLPWAPAFLRLFYASSDWNGVPARWPMACSGAAQAPPPAELDDVFVIAITARAWPLAAPRQCGAALSASLPAESASVAGPELSSIPREAREKGRGAPSASAAHCAIKTTPRSCKPDRGCAGHLGTSASVSCLHLPWDSS
jgi:hypothetical protein